MMPKFPASVKPTAGYFRQTTRGSVWKTAIASGS